MNIAEFEEKTRKFNRNHEYRSTTQIGFDKSYYGVTFDPDASMEIDIACKSEETMKEIVNFLCEKRISIMEPDYSSIEYGWNKAFIPNWTPTHHDIKYYYEKEFGWYRINLLPQGKHIRNLYQFIDKTQNFFLDKAKQTNETIFLIPFQLDGVIDGEYHFTPEGIINTLKFDFGTEYARYCYITACILNELCDNQSEFDSLITEHN